MKVMKIIKYKHSFFGQPKAKVVGIISVLPVNPNQ